MANGVSQGAAPTKLLTCWFTLMRWLSFVDTKKLNGLMRLNGRGGKRGWRTCRRKLAKKHPRRQRLSTPKSANAKKP